MRPSPQFLILTLWLVLGFGCASSENTLKTSDTGSTFTRSAGDTLTLELTGNPQLRATWEVLAIDSTLVRFLDEEPKFELKAAGAGFPSVGVYTYRLRLLQPGQTTLKMALKRPNDPTPLDEFTISLQIE